MQEIRVQGMSCMHCRKAVLEAVLAVPGVAEAYVDLDKGLLSFEGGDVEEVKKAVRRAGYEVAA